MRTRLASPLPATSQMGPKATLLSPPSVTNHRHQGGSRLNLLDRTVVTSDYPYINVLMHAYVASSSISRRERTLSAVATRPKSPVAFSFLSLLSAHRRNVMSSQLSVSANCCTILNFLQSASTRENVREGEAKKRKVRTKRRAANQTHPTNDGGEDE